MLRLRADASAWLWISVATSLGSAQAATEWSVDPQLTLQSQHNTNPYLVHSPESTVTTHRFDLALPMTGESDVTKLHLEPQLHVIRNRHASEQDRDEYSVDADLRRMLELGWVGVKGSYIRDTTLTSEFFDTGILNVNKRRDLRSLEPYLNMALAPRINLMTGLKYRTQSYHDAEATPLMGYEYAQANGGISYEIDDRDLMRCGIDHSRMNTERVTSEDTGLSCTLVREQTEQLRGSLTLGGHRTSSSSGSVTQSRSGSLVALDLDYETEKMRWGLRGSRSVEPSGYGLLLRSDQLTITAAYDFNGWLWASASLAANRYAMMTSAYDYPDRDYEALRWRVVWQWSPEWSIEGGVNHARQRYENNTSYARATTVIAQLAYRPDNN